MDGDGGISPPQEEGDKVAVDRKPPAFSIEDLLAEFKADDIPDGVTVQELCAKAGLRLTRQNISRVGGKIHDLCALGLWEFVGKKACISQAGDPRLSPAYRPKEDSDG